MLQTLMTYVCKQENKFIKQQRGKISLILSTLLLLLAVGTAISGIVCMFTANSFSSFICGLGTIIFGPGACLAGWFVIRIHAEQLSAQERMEQNLLQLQQSIDSQATSIVQAITSSQETMVKTMQTQTANMVKAVASSQKPAAKAAARKAPAKRSSPSKSDS